MLVILLDSIFEKSKIIECIVYPITKYSEMFKVFYQPLLDQI